jgi:hypothetical protein
VFLGYRLLDQPFRHLYQTLLRRAFAKARMAQAKYMICSPPPVVNEEDTADSDSSGEWKRNRAYGRMEVENWRLTQDAAVRIGVSVLEEWPAKFLAAVLQGITKVQ